MPLNSQFLEFPPNTQYNILLKMDAKVIDGKAIAKKREQELKDRLDKLSKKPKVVSILVGEDPPSVLYTQMKQKKAQELGIDFQFIHYRDTEDFSNVLHTIVKLNKDPQANGIMVQLPLPQKFLKGKKGDDLVMLIDPKKDVDGLTGRGVFLPAAVKAVMVILEEEKIEVKGKFVAVLGQSRLVGMPVANELKKLGAMVSSCNSQTPNIQQITQRADIVVSATGKANTLTGDMVKEGVVVIDIGTLVIEDELNQNNSKVVGDVDFESVYPKASKITPVPGGVGPVTVVSLFENLAQT